MDVVWWRLALNKDKTDEMSNSCRWEDMIHITTTNNEKFEAQSGFLIDYESQLQMLRKNIENIEKDRDKTIATITQVNETLTTVKKVKKYIMTFLIAIVPEKEVIPKFSPVDNHFDSSQRA